jgi:hypothetical protein
MDSIIIGAVIGVLFLIQGLINIRFNYSIITLQERLDTLEQLHWARTNPIRLTEAVVVEDPDCGTPSNI